MLDEVRSHGPGGLVLHGFQQNAEAHAFYERHGFAVVDTGDGSRKTTAAATGRTCRT